MSQTRSTATLPEGVSLRRIGEVLSDAWEAGAHQWTDTPLLLREGPASSPPAPTPGDVLDLFRLLQERAVDYLLVGGMAMLTYVNGRNTKDVDLLMSVEALEKIPELQIEDQKDFFARGKFRSLQVDLLLTENPLFRIVRERFATTHRFAELSVPAAAPEGLIVLKLYALLSLYRQMGLDRAAIYENDVTMLLARHPFVTAPLVELVSQHVEKGDVKELQKIVSECVHRAQQLRLRTNTI